MRNFLLKVLFSMFVLTSTVYACPNCKNAYAQDPTLALIGEAYNYSIFLMILVPFILIGSITFLVIKNSKKH